MGSANAKPFCQLGDTQISSHFASVIYPQCTPHKPECDFISEFLTLKLLIPNSNVIIELGWVFFFFIAFGILKVFFFFFIKLSGLEEFETLLRHD